MIIHNLAMDFFSFQNSLRIQTLYAVSLNIVWNLFCCKILTRLRSITV